MQRLKQKLEELDEALFALEDKVGTSKDNSRENTRKYNELVKQLRARESNLMAIAQKTASRLDQAIEDVENILRH